jgi:alkylhydroperoxidase family enzyme
MPRLPQVPRDEATDDVKQAYDRLFGDRDPVANPGTATGTPGNWWTVFALSPDILEHCQRGFAMFNSRKRELTPKLREIAQTRTGWAAGSQFVFSQHCKGARAAGLTEEQIATLPSWPTSSAFNEEERAVLAYVDDLVLHDGRVSDGTFAALQKHLSPVAIMELSYAALTYRLHATMCRALRLEYDDVDERVVEIPAPSGQSADIMRDISR